MTNMNKINQDYLEIKDRIVTFIRTRVKDAGTNGAVIGLSGGIDSTLTAYLATEALGSDNVLGILLPEKNITSKQDIDDAIEITKILCIDYRIIYISDILQCFLTSLSKFNKANFSKNDSKGNLIANGNLKARIRMCILYHHANTMNRMVIGTGNKTELLLGYFTKYGDGGVDIEPIGDLYKTDVRGLSQVLDIPHRIIDKVPTAGLWPGQTDEGELGISYETIDKILTMLVDEKQEITIIKKKFPPEQVDILSTLIRTNEHKRISARACELEMNK